jgi:uncharacterized protein YndB with AHSA1/START domain
MIEKSVLLRCDTSRAFLLFTEHISEWWPPERRHTGDAASQLFLTQAGRFCERALDGREVDLGKVRAWEPPTRLLLDFYPGTDAAHPTEVEVVFRAEDGGTRVTVYHRPTELSRDLFAGRAPRYVASWDLCLASLLDFGNKMVTI